MTRQKGGAMADDREPCGRKTPSDQPDPVVDDMLSGASWRELPVRATTLRARGVSWSEIGRALGVFGARQEFDVSPSGVKVRRHLSLVGLVGSPMG